MQSSKSTVVRVTLILEEAEAFWLGKLVQLPVDGASEAQEAEEDTRMRRLFQDAVSGMQYPSKNK